MPVLGDSTNKRTQLRPGRAARLAGENRLSDQRDASINLPLIAAIVHKPDFSAFLLQAKASGAKVIGLANGGDVSLRGGNEAAASLFARAPHALST